MKSLSMLLAAAALLAGCAGDGMFSTSGHSGFRHDESRYDESRHGAARHDTARAADNRAANPLNNPVSPYPYYGD